MARTTKCDRFLPLLFFIFCSTLYMCHYFWGWHQSLTSPHAHPPCSQQFWARRHKQLGNCMCRVCVSEECVAPRNHIMKLNSRSAKSAAPGLLNAPPLLDCLTVTSWHVQLSLHEVCSLSIWDLGKLALTPTQQVTLRWRRLRWSFGINTVLTLLFGENFGS